MTLGPGTRLVAVYDTQDEAVSAVRRAHLPHHRDWDERFRGPV